MKYTTFFAAIVIGTGAWAGDTFDVGGSTVGMSTSKMVPFGDTHVFMDMQTTYTMPENGTPVAGMTGDCFGYMEIAVGTGATGSGTCVWSDAEGDTWVGPWSVHGMTPELASLGTWVVTGGTGKFAGASGGGTFTALTNPQTGESKLDVAGSMVLN